MPNKDPIKRKEYMKSYYKANKGKFRLNDKTYKEKNKDKFTLLRKANPEREYLYRRKATLKNKFGITLEQYDSMVLLQKGLCLICKQKCRSGKILSIDHCHKTGKVRGLLCRDCNSGIEFFKDDIKRLENAISYLSRHRETGNSKTPTQH